MKLDLSEIVEYYGSDSINLSLLEIGCKPDGKRSQLKKKRELFLSNIEDSFSLNVYRGLAHYCPRCNVKLDEDPYEVDYLIICNYFTDEMFKFTKKNKKDLFNFARKERSKEFLEKILQNKRRDFDKFIRNCKKEYYGSLRGKIAEIMINNYVLRNKPKDIIYYQNPITTLEDENYYHGTEIDGVFVFKEKNYFIEFLERLDKKKNLEVTINGKFNHQ